MQVGRELVTCCRQEKYLLSGRYDPEHIRALNLLAVEADIDLDLGMGGPTPQITSHVNTASRRGRGRGGGGPRDTNGYRHTAPATGE